MGGLVSWLLTACGAIPGASARRTTEEWLRTRPWVAEVEQLRTVGGPVPLPQRMHVYAQVRAVPGTGRVALAGIRAEIEAFAAAETRQLSGLEITVGFDTGQLPISGTVSTNEAVFAIMDPVLAEPRTQWAELAYGEALLATVTVPPGEVLGYAGWLAGLLPDPDAGRLTVRDDADSERVTASFGQIDRLRALEPMLAAARAVAPVPGFTANTMPNITELRLNLATRSAIEAVFRALRDRWAENDLDLTAQADRLGARGAVTALDRLPAAATLADAAPFGSLLVLDLSNQPEAARLAASLSEPESVAAAAAALGAHPEAAGGGLAGLVLDPMGRVRLTGTPAEIAAWGGPAQAVVTGPGDQPSATGREGILRLSVSVQVDLFAQLCRSIRANGWDGKINFFVDEGIWAVRYSSTARGPAEDVVVQRSVGTIDGAREWIRAWDASASE